MSLLDDARAIGADAASRALEIEAARSVPEDVIRQLGRAGVFRLFVPAALGGTEADPMTAFEVIEELARSDGSLGWTAMILNTTLFACWLEPAVTKEMLSTDPELGMAGLFSPVGQAVAEGDGSLRLSGRFPFNSGSPHATWFCEGAMVTSEGAEPAWRFLFLPASDVEILDTWHVAGLRGTASHDVAVRDAVVPIERTANPLFEQADHDAPHFRWSFFGLLSALITGFPLGVARRALDELEVLAATKGRGGGPPLATEQVVQLEVVRMEGLLRSARAFMLDAAGAAWETACHGDRVSREERLAVRMAALNGMRAAVDVVDTAFSLAGGSAIYDSSPLQRCWRDLHAGSNHIFFSNNQTAVTGQLLLGLPSDEWVV